MKGILTIAWKDLKGYITGPTFYIVAGLLLSFLTVTFWSSVIYFSRQSVMMMMQTRGQGGGLNLHDVVMIRHVGQVNLVMLFLVPFLTVRLFTEEKKFHTYDLLLTSPVTSSQIMLGKFLAAMGAVSVLVAMSFVFPLALSFFTEIQWKMLLSAYAGLLFLVGAYVAVGLFASSLTESVILAGFVSIILSFALWFVSWIGAVAEDSTVAAVFNHLSVAGHFEQFVKGSVQSVAILFFISVAGLYCFLTQRVVESARWR